MMLIMYLINVSFGPCLMFQKRELTKVDQNGRRDVLEQGVNFTEGVGCVEGKGLHPFPSTLFE